ncbi:MAG: hydroxymethylbilane synthase [Dehalococcoidia bacterium]|nr:hydroxymethylbilane synthase [Dehalococcoidia bacterium]
MRKLILGTRGSALARRQTQIVSDALRRIAPDIEIEIKAVQTEGDRRQDVSLEAFGGEGVFVKDIERRLAAGEIDIAVHSLKDMPARSPDGLTIGTVLPRGDVRDVLVGRGGARLDALPPGARLGSDSRRRAVQVLALRSDVEMISIRGNVDTRLRKVQSGDYDGVLLAAAGLERLGLIGEVSQFFSVDEVLPAVGQAVLAVQCRADDAETLSLLGRVDDPTTRAAITAERAFLDRLGAGCRLPVGAYAEVSGRRLHLRGLLADDSGRIARDDVTGAISDAEQVGVELALRLASELNLELVR